MPVVHPELENEASYKAWYRDGNPFHYNDHVQAVVPHMSPQLLADWTDLGGVGAAYSPSPTLEANKPILTPGVNDKIVPGKKKKGAAAAAGGPPVTLFDQELAQWQEDVDVEQAAFEARKADLENRTAAEQMLYDTYIVERTRQEAVYEGQVDNEYKVTGKPEITRYRRNRNRAARDAAKDFRKLNAKKEEDEETYHHNTYHFDKNAFESRDGRVNSFAKMLIILQPKILKVVAKLLTIIHSMRITYKSKVSGLNLNRIAPEDYQKIKTILDSFFEIAKRIESDMQTMGTIMFDFGSANTIIANRKIGEKFRVDFDIANTKFIKAIDDFDAHYESDVSRYAYNHGKI